MGKKHVGGLFGDQSRELGLFKSTFGAPPSQVSGQEALGIDLSFDKWLNLRIEKVDTKTWPLPSGVDVQHSMSMSY